MPGDLTRSKPTLYLLFFSKLAVCTNSTAWEEGLLVGSWWTKQRLTKSVTCDKWTPDLGLDILVIQGDLEYIIFSPPPPAPVLKKNKTIKGAGKNASSSLNMTELYITV